MTTLAIIPARGGSERIPRKNLRQIRGKSLLEWTVKDALGAAGVDDVVVTSDDNEVLGIASQWVGVTPHKRPDEYATNDCGIEPVITDVLQSHPCDTVVLMNCCCPLRDETAIDRALAYHKSKQSCCTFSACDWNGLTWQYCVDKWYPNYDVYSRPRSQDWTQYVRETGSFWIFGADHIEVHGSMLCEKGHPFLTAQIDSLDIDTEADFEMAKLLLPMRRNV